MSSTALSKTSDDKEFAGIVLWLLVTDQEAHVRFRSGVSDEDLSDHDCQIRLRPSRWADRRRKRREGQATLSAAEAKRLRKMEKRRNLL